MTFSEFKAKYPGHFNGPVYHADCGLEVDYVQWKDRLFVEGVDSAEAILGREFILEFVADLIRLKLDN